MAYSAKHLKESLGQGEDMERDDERVDTHISGVRNLSEEAREMRAAGRKLVGGVEEKADDLSDYRRLSGSVKKLKESVDAQRAEVNQAVKKMDQTLYEMRNLVDRVEELYNSTKDETHSAEQAALNGVNKAQEKAQEITLRNIDEATQRSKKAIDTMVLESKRRIERLAMVTLPDRMFHFLKWTALMLVLFILVHIAWQMLREHTYRFKLKNAPRSRRGIERKNGHGRQEGFR